MKSFYNLLVSAALGAATGFAAFAQTDVSDLLMENYGFDEAFDYDRSASGNVAQEILDVKGWSKTHTLDYTIVGTYEFGTSVTFNSTGRIPAAGFDGSRGCLALSTGWDESLSYCQEVTLPAGDWTLKSAWYNGSGKTGGSSLVGWIPDAGTRRMSTLEAFPDGEWTLDEQTFSLSSETKGKIQLGFKAVSNGSVNSAKVVLDFVKLLLPDSQALTLIRGYLSDAAAVAESAYGNGSGTGAAALKKEIDNAKALLADNSSAYSSLHDAYFSLKAITDSYLNDNASETNPRDITASQIRNGSFETSTDGWEINGMASQTNAYFTEKQGNTYMEAWVNRGEQLGTASLTQAIASLPAGKYRLSAAALHIQQSAAGSNQNLGDPQTGASLIAGEYSAQVTDMNRYNLDFAVVYPDKETIIGLVAEAATGNWLTVDDFRLYYTGPLDAKAFASYLRIGIEKAEHYLALGVQESVKILLENTLSEARAALEANTEDALRDAVDAMTAANAKAAASRELYDNLEDAIVYAEKVYGWWNTLESKSEACSALSEAIVVAGNAAGDFSLSDSELKDALATLNGFVKKVDKGIYESDAAVGRGDKLNDPANEWCYQRSIQSKHWILFWDKGYGNTVPAGLDNILATADGTFEHYAEELGFITINEGKSKTDRYKMIIRLRSSSEWEASGSGIDNTIGLLTLSRWAYTSRNGQTLGHEIGHCFQYQVHCDNNNWNGWMYTWNGSPNGNVFWEMCAQWQAYKYFPEMQFNNNEWLSTTLRTLNKNPFDEEIRYNSFFIQDWFTHRHDIRMTGRLWNESRDPEDPFQAYMRITMGGTGQEQVALLGDEMWEYAAHMTTFDFDHLSDLGKATIGSRPQPAMTDDGDDYFIISEEDCPENYGNNAIRVRAPAEETIVAADFEGLAGHAGFRNVNIDKAGWRIGFVAYKNDGTRVYGDMTRIAAGDSPRRVYFKCPGGFQYLWFVVSGAPLTYWERGWDGNTSNDEQWPYRVRFRNTNLIGKKVVTEDFSGVGEIESEEISAPVYTLTGICVREAGEGTEGLPAGIYISGGRKIVIR